MPLKDTSSLAVIAHAQMPAAFEALIQRTIGAGKALGATIAIRRNGTTLGDQDVRIVHRASAMTSESSGAEQPAQRALVVGDTTFDVQVGDRFNDADGVLFEVTFVRPNRQPMIVAEAKAVQ